MTAALAACQFEPVVGDLATNYDRMDDVARRLDDDVELAVFPELCVTGYDLDVAAERATTVPGESTDRLVAMADRHDVHVVAGVPERSDGAVYNSLVLVDGDGVQATYRKQYLWGDETTTFEAGTGPVVAETPVGTVGMLVCYDLNFPEAAVDYARRDWDVLAVSAAWRADFVDDWRLLLRARALDGTCYVVGSNHVGDQRGREHAGTSLVAGPQGDCLAVADDASTGDGDAAVAAVTDEALRTARERNPVLEARR